MHSSGRTGASSPGDDAAGRDAGTERMLTLMQGMLQSQMEQTSVVQQQAERQREYMERQDARWEQLRARAEAQEQGPRVGTVEQFYKLRPTLFSGDESALEAEDWIVAIDESLQAARIAEEDKIPMVKRLLRGNARSWWLTEQGGPEVEPISWKQFMERFMKQFFPDTEAAVLEEQFTALVQGDKSVDQYAAEFTRLSRFAPDLVTTEAKKVKRFRRGLKSEVRCILAAQQFGSFADILQAARLQEREMQTSETQLNSGKRSVGEGMSGAAPLQQGRTKVRDTSSSSRTPLTCQFCGKQGHVMRECRSRLGLCLSCGGRDHSHTQCQNRRRPAGSSGDFPGLQFQQPVELVQGSRQMVAQHTVHQFAPGQSSQRPGGRHARQPLPSQREMYGQRMRQKGRGSISGRGRADPMLAEPEE